MFGINYIKFDPTIYVIKFSRGHVVKEGRGLSFFYFAPTTSIVAVPAGSTQMPFIFNETTRDHQTISIQGQITYKISQPRQLAELLDFTVDGKGLYKKDDTENLNLRIVNEAQTATSAYVHELGLKEVIRAAKSIEAKISEGVTQSASIAQLGVEVLGVNILAVKASPEMERALETETREKLQQEADQAIYERRNFAVEQERRIQESELNTEIAVQEKKKQIRESELNTEIAVEEKRKQIAQKKSETDVQQAEHERRLRELRIKTDIAIEQQRKELTELKAVNERNEADVKGYTIETLLKPYRDMDWRTLTALSQHGDAKANIALAFRELAENAGKIGNLHITPELLDSLVTKRDG